MLKGNWNLCLGEYKQDFLTKGWRKTLEIGLGYRCFYIKHIFSFHLYYASDRYYYQVIVLMRMANVKLKLNYFQSCGYKYATRFQLTHLTLDQDLSLQIARNMRISLCINSLKSPRN